MRFDDSFTVPVGPAEVWDALTDIERVSRCLPGAELTEIRDNEFHGVVTVKLGPIAASYKGSARFESLDEESRTLFINAQGRDRHGQGNARARVRAVLVPSGDGTRVEMTNDVDITGKAAQFGRGILPDVSREIMSQFAANLRQVVTRAPDAAAGEPAVDRPQAPVASAEPISAARLSARVVASRFRADPLRATLAVVAAVALGLMLRRGLK